MCLVGCTELQINTRSAHLGDHTISTGDWITLDGTDGSIHGGPGECLIEKPTDLLAEVAARRKTTKLAPAAQEGPLAHAEYPNLRKGLEVAVSAGTSVQQLSDIFAWLRPSS